MTLKVKGRSVCDMLELNVELFTLTSRNLAETFEVVIRV